jgi:hypothetical protein
MQGLGGTAGGSGAPGLNKAASMSGNKEFVGGGGTNGIIDQISPIAAATDISGTFTITIGGVYEIVLQGAGGTGSAGVQTSGGGGGISYAKRRFAAGATITYVVAAGNASNTTSTAILPDGTVLSVTAAVGQISGAGSGGDYNGAGTNASGSNAGVAASYLGYKGGRRGEPGYIAQAPGGGGNGQATISVQGADGRMIITKIAS